MRKFSFLKMCLFSFFVLISLTAWGQKSIKLIDYATVEFKGLDGKATAKVQLDAEGIMKNGKYDIEQILPEKK